MIFEADNITCYKNQTNKTNQNVLYQSPEIPVPIQNTASHPNPEIQEI